MGKDTSSDDAPVMLLAEEQDEMLQLLERQMQQRFGEILTHTHDVSQKTSDANGTSTDTAEDVTAGTVSQDTANEASSSYFRLFNTGPQPDEDINDGISVLPRVRLQSPTDLILLHGRSLNRILAVEDEAKSAVKERKRQIKSVAVEADWILKTSDSSYWSPFPQPSRKLLQRTLLTPSKARKPLAQVAILYSPKPKSSLKNLKVRENVDMKGRVKLKSYPDLSKERIEDRIAKRMKKRAAVLVNDPMSSSNIIKSVRKTTKKPESKHSRTKRKSKKRRLHERESKVAQIS